MMFECRLMIRGVAGGGPLGGSCMNERMKERVKYSLAQALIHPVVAFYQLHMLSESPDSIVGG